MFRLVLFLAALLAIAGCQTTSQHQFAQPADWQTRAGQMLYDSGKTRIAGDVLIRYSATGDFELTFSKGPGVNLLLLRQDAQFAHAEGPLARGSWSGSVADAPEHLRGWVALRDAIVAAPMQRQVRKATGDETFLLLF